MSQTYNGAQHQLTTAPSPAFNTGGVTERNQQGAARALHNLTGLGEQMIRLEDFSTQQADEAALNQKAREFDIEVENRLMLPDGHSDSFFESNGTLRQRKVDSLTQKYRKDFEGLGTHIIDPEARQRMQARAQNAVDGMGAALISRGAKEAQRKAMANYQNNQALALERGDYGTALNANQAAVAAGLIPQSEADLASYRIQQQAYSVDAQNAWNQSPDELARLYDEGHFDDASPEVMQNVQRMLERAGGMSIPTETVRRTRGSDGRERLEKLPPEAPRGLPSYLVGVWNQNQGNFKTPDARDAAMPLLANWARSQITHVNDPQEEERVKAVFRAYGASDDYASSIIKDLRRGLGAGQTFDPDDSWGKLPENSFFSTDQQNMIQGWKDELEQLEASGKGSSKRAKEVKANLAEWEGYNTNETDRANAHVMGQFTAWRAQNPNADYRDQFTAYWRIKDHYLDTRQGRDFDHTTLSAYKDYESTMIAHEAAQDQGITLMKDAKAANDEDVAKTEAQRDQLTAERAAQLPDQTQAESSPTSDTGRTLTLSSQRGVSNALQGNATESILYVPKGSGITESKILIRAEGNTASYARVVETDQVSQPTMSRRLRGNLGDYTGRQTQLQITGNQARLSRQAQKSSLDVGSAIVKAEARRDTQGRIRVYKLPAGDGGGRYEVAGINEKYHPKQAAHLKRLIETGQHQQAEEEAASYIMNYTQPVANNLGSMGVKGRAVEYYMRDIAFNGGAGGAYRVLNRAFGISGSKITAATRQAVSSYIQSQGEDALLDRLRDARKAWYRGIAERKPKKRQFLKGWLNRTEKTYSTARQLA